MTPKHVFWLALAALLTATATSSSGPAARVGDAHTCGGVHVVSGPLGVPTPVPRGAGPVLTGDPRVLLCGKPAARLGDQAGCTHGQDTIITGSSSVLIGGKPAARQNDSTSQGGRVIAGCPSVLIGP